MASLSSLLSSIPPEKAAVDPSRLAWLRSRAPRRFVGWQTFFDFGGVFTADARPNKRIDTKVSTPLFTLPLGTIFNGQPPISLMQRNLLRCLTWKLPSGQHISREMGIPPLNNDDLAELEPISPSFVDSTPLLYYILKEAELKEDGLRLGPTGARIVAEVFVGLLQLDPNSYFNVQPSWVPTLPTHDGTPQSFRMIDFSDLCRRGSHKPRSIIDE